MTDAARIEQLEAALRQAQRALVMITEPPFTVTSAQAYVSCRQAELAARKALEESE